MTKTKDMTIEEAMTYCFKDVVYPNFSPAPEKRKCFKNRLAAYIYSENNSHLWNEGLGIIYGPFCDKQIQPEGDNMWWEVSYK